MKVFYSPLPVLLIILLFASPIISQQSQGDKSKPSNQDESIIKLASTLVQVPVIVSEPGGRYVIDLTKKDFSIFEDGVKQEIEFFGSVDEPFNVALLIDSSGSTIEQLDKIKESAKAFIDKLKDNDKVMIVSFNDSVQIHCELTSDRDHLSRAVRAVRPGEYTQVYEAIYTAVWERLNDVKGRKAVILFSDGIDTASSEIGQDDTLDAIIESEDIIIYPIRFHTRPEVERRILKNLSSKDPHYIEKKAAEFAKLNQLYQNADEYLTKLAEMSGGIIERADSINDLDQAFSKIAEELRHQYLLGYYPTGSKEERAERKIKVTVFRNKLKVRARPSYLSPN